MRFDLHAPATQSLAVQAFLSFSACLKHMLTSPWICYAYFGLLCLSARMGSGDLVFRKCLLAGSLCNASERLEAPKASQITRGPLRIAGRRPPRRQVGRPP